MSGDPEMKLQPFGCVYAAGMATDPTPGTSDTAAEIVDTTLAEAIIEMDIDAPVQDVWDKLTTTEGLASWMGEGSTIGSRCGDELHVHDIVTGQYRRGVLDEVTPARRLGYTWWPETRPHQATRVAISLDPHPGGTRVTVIESRPLPAAKRAPQARACATVSATSSAWVWRSAMLTLSLRPGVAALVG